MGLFQQDLLKMQNLKYKNFHKTLIPNVNEKTVIGIPIPVLRRYAKKLGENASSFLEQLPHAYYEENMLHGILISQENDMECCLKKVNAFLPFVDNWAVCDSLRPKCFAKNKKRMLEEIPKWLASSHAYTLRFAIEMLMVHFLDEDFHKDYLCWVSRVNHEDYYVNMMVAWYFATALAKQWEATFPYITEVQLSPFVHNKTIQKAVESYRITAEKKQQLKGYKIKESNGK